MSDGPLLESYAEARWQQPWIEVRAALTPERVAAELPDRVLRYGELAERARAAAALLRERGVERGDVVAVHLGNGLSLLELVHALSLCGAVLLPLNLRLSSVELLHQLRDSGARLLVHEGAGAAARAAAALPELATLALAEGCSAADIGGGVGRRPPSGAARLDLTDPFALLYTSGTTGTPKGALLSHGSFLASAAASAQLLGTGADERWLVCMPLFHVGGLSILLRSALAGSAAIIHERFEAAVVARALDEEEITIVSLVPVMLGRLLAERGEREAPARLRCVLLGGAAAPSGLLEKARRLGYPVAPTYGLTEACSQVATRPPGVAYADGPGLFPLPGIELRIVDDTAAAVPAGVAGEICVSGPVVMRGYLGRPDATAATLREGWLHTGDAGLLDAEGRLHVLDRRDDLIVSGGENVYPAEVEAVLLDHPAVAEAGVAGASDPEFGARPVAWIVVEEGATFHEAALREHCRGRLAAYKVPLRFHRAESLPRNAAGKLLRRELAESEASR